MSNQTIENSENNRDEKETTDQENQIRSIWSG
jgi:hypothetical protein